jgi:hypothetical protein
MSNSCFCISEIHNNSYLITFLNPEITFPTYAIFAEQAFITTLNMNTHSLLLRHKIFQTAAHPLKNLGAVHHEMYM